MDKRLKLNDKQKALIKQLAKVLKDLKKAKVGIVVDTNELWFDSFLFYNNSEVLEIEGYDKWEKRDEYEVDDDEENTVWHTPNYQDLEKLKVNIDFESDNNNWFSVLLEKNEDVDISIKNQEKANQLKILVENKNKLKAELQQYQDSVTDAENNIKILEEKGVPKEIIDEERVNIENNKAQIEILKRKIKGLNCDIKIIKSIEV